MWFDVHISAVDNMIRCIKTKTNWERGVKRRRPICQLNMYERFSTIGLMPIEQWKFCTVDIYWEKKSSVNGRGHCINEVPSSMNSPSSLLTTLHKQQLMSKFITTNIYYCCSGPSATKYFPFQNVIVNIHVLWLPTKRRTVHKKVSEPGLPGFTLLREQFRSDIPFVSEMYERRTGKMGVPSGVSTTLLIKIRFYQQREQDMEPHIYCKEKWKNSKLFNFQWTQIDLCIEYRYVCTSVL